MIVQSLLLPVSLNSIEVVVTNGDRASIRRLPAGDVMKPDNVADIVNPAAAVAVLKLEMTVAPSHNLQYMRAPIALSVKVSVPDTYQVPTVPCATAGPLK